MPAAELPLIIRTYETQSARVRNQLLDFMTRTWAALGDDLGDDNVAQWVALVGPRLEATQQRMSALTSAYFAAADEAVLGESTLQALAARNVTSQALRGVGTEELLKRAGTTVYSALADGHRFDQAKQMGLDRATSMAETNVQLARTHTALHVLSKDEGVVGYRRVLRSARPCALCAVASTQRYHRRQLLPIHPGCHCSVAKIYGTHDPGHVIDPNRLEQVHQQVAERFGATATDAREVDGVLTAKGDIAQYKDLVVVHEHGEIGPVLGVRGQNFDGPSDIAA